MKSGRGSENGEFKRECEERIGFGGLNFSEERRRKGKRESAGVFEFFGGKLPLKACFGVLAVNRYFVYLGVLTAREKP